MSHTENRTQVSIEDKIAERRVFCGQAKNYGLAEIFRPKRDQKSPFQIEKAQHGNIQRM